MNWKRKEPGPCRQYSALVIWQRNEIVVRFPAGTSSEVYPSSYSVGTWTLLPEAQNWPHLHQIPRLRISTTISPLPHMPLWNVQGQFYFILEKETFNGRNVDTFPFPNFSFGGTKQSKEVLFISPIIPQSHSAPVSVPSNVADTKCFANNSYQMFCK